MCGSRVVPHPSTRHTQRGFTSEFGWIIWWFPHGMTGWDYHTFIHLIMTEREREKKEEDCIIIIYPLWGSNPRPLD